MKTFDYIVGCDPGVHTGLAIFHGKTGNLHSAGSYSIIEAMEIIKDLEDSGSVFLRIEDARLRKWYGKNSNAKAQGAGSVKRDCKIWEEFCAFYGIENQFVSPKGQRTKMNAKAFEHYTGCKLRLNEHGRDAYLLAWGFKPSTHILNSPKR